MDEKKQILEELSSSIKAILSANQPFVHCSKINDLLQALRHISEDIEKTVPSCITPKKYPFKYIKNTLDELQKLIFQCSQEQMAQFCIVTPIEMPKEQIQSIRAVLEENLDSIGLSKLSDHIRQSDPQLDPQDKVDITRLSQVFIKFLEKKEFARRPDIAPHFRKRVLSFSKLGITFSDEEIDTVTIPQLPPSLNLQLSIDDIEIGKQIGIGMSGRVLKGILKSTGQPVAIKVLHKRSFTPTELELFRREICTMSLLSHPSLIKFYGYTAESPYCILTEYMKNGSLFDFLRHRPSELTPTDRTLIAIDVARGMEFLHQNSIIHRDLKSLNILLDQKKRAKICDFGFARLKSSNPMTGLVGTSHWMAPEILMSSPFYDEKVDVYSYSIVLWELLTGSQPYSNEDPVAVVRMIAEQNRRPKIPENTPPLLSKLIENCWETDSKKRPNFTQISEMLLDKRYQFPGTDPIVVEQEAGLSARHATVLSQPFEGILKRKLNRLKEAIDMGNIQDFSNSLCDLRKSVRNTEVNWGGFIGEYSDLCLKSGERFKARLVWVLFEFLAYNGAAESLKGDVIPELLKGELSDSILGELSIRPQLFGAGTVDILLEFSKGEKMQRSKALRALFAAESELSKDPIKFERFLSFTTRKAGCLLGKAVETSKNVLKEIKEITETSKRRLADLIDIAPKEMLADVSDCLVEAFRFGNDDFYERVWAKAWRSFDRCEKVFAYFCVKKPKNFSRMVEFLKLSAREFDGAIKILVELSKEKENLPYIIKVLPIGKQGAMTAELYRKVIEFGGTEAFALAEFYAKEIFGQNLSGLYLAVKSGRLKASVLSKFTPEIEQRFIEESRDDDEAIIAYVMQKALADGPCEVSGSSIPKMVTLMERDGMASISGFFCLALLWPKFGPKIPFEKISKKAKELQISQDTEVREAAEKFIKDATNSKEQ